MTFDEAWKQIRESSVPIQIPDEAGDAEILESDLIDIFEELRQEYAPTIEMTKTDKERLLYDLENYSFYAFIETVHRSKSGVFGIPGNNDFNNLSDEDLMQAWLHPETIKKLTNS